MPLSLAEMIAQMVMITVLTGAGLVGWRMWLHRGAPERNLNTLRADLREEIRQELNNTLAEHQERLDEFDDRLDFAERALLNSAPPREREVPTPV